MGRPTKAWRSIAFSSQIAKFRITVVYTVGCAARNQGGSKYGWIVLKVIPTHSLDANYRITLHHLTTVCNKGKPYLLFLTISSQYQPVLPALHFTGIIRTKWFSVFKLK